MFISGHRRIIHDYSITSALTLCTRSVGWTVRHFVDAPSMILEDVYENITNTFFKKLVQHTKKPPSSNMTIPQTKFHSSFQRQSEVNGSTVQSNAPALIQNNIKRAFSATSRYTGYQCLWKVTVKLEAEADSFRNLQVLWSAWFLVALISDLKHKMRSLHLLHWKPSCLFSTIQSFFLF